MGIAGQHNSRIAPGLFALAAGLWFTSLLLPAVAVRGGPDFSGYDVLVEGWSAWRIGVLAWFANPLLLVAVVTGWRHHGRVSLASAAAGAALAATSLWSSDIARAGGTQVPELSFEIGFYCWMSAQLAAIGGAAAEIAVRHFGART